MLAQAVYEQGRHDEAEELCRASEGAAASTISRPRSPGGECARSCARTEALRTRRTRSHGRRYASPEPTDFLTIRADALLDLAAVLRRSGQSSEADESIRAALELYEQKGDVVSAERARTQLAASASSGGAG